MATNNQTSTATNLQGPNIGSANNNANKYFNNFYTVDMSVGASNDIITAYFEKYTGDLEAGKNLAATVIYTAKAQNLDPLEVLSQFQQLPANQLNNYLIAFLNSNRVPTSVLGVKTSNTVNSYVARSILV